MAVVTTIIAVVHAVLWLLLLRGSGTVPDGAGDVAVGVLGTDEPASELVDLAGTNVRESHTLAPVPL